MAKALKQREDALQEAVAKYMALQYPGILFFHVPNGGRRDVITGAALKRQGVKRGVPDCFIEAPRGCYHGLRIELKVGTNKLSDDQKRLREYYVMQGYYYEVVYSFDQFKSAVDYYLNLK